MHSEKSRIDLTEINPTEEPGVCLMIEALCNDLPGTMSTVEMEFEESFPVWEFENLSVRVLSLKIMRIGDSYRCQISQSDNESEESLISSVSVQFIEGDFIEGRMLEGSDAIHARLLPNPTSLVGYGLYSVLSWMEDNQDKQGAEFMTFTNETL